MAAITPPFINKKDGWKQPSEICFRGACQNLILAGMSMKKLYYFKQYLKQRPVILSDNIVVL